MHFKHLNLHERICRASLITAFNLKIDQTTRDCKFLSAKVNETMRRERTRHLIDKFRFFIAVHAEREQTQDSITLSSFYEPLLLSLSKPATIFFLMTRAIKFNCNNTSPINGSASAVADSGRS